DLDGRSDESYEVEAILGHELTAEGVRYTAKWKGYDSPHNPQLEYDNFDSDLIIRRYWKRLNQQNPHVIAKQAEKEKRVQRKTLRQQMAQQKPISKDASKGKRGKKNSSPRKKAK
ncbi:hypothetical protein BGZ54_005534, partial [Gamsiella multidivaricata]